MRLAEAMTHYNKAFESYYSRQSRDRTLLRIITDLVDLYLAVDSVSRLQGGNVLCLTQVGQGPAERHHRIHAARRTGVLTLLHHAACGRRSSVCSRRGSASRCVWTTTTAPHPTPSPPASG